MYWQPRLTKPPAQSNSYLFRAQSHTDLLEVCWLLPPSEMWDQYNKGNVTEDEWVFWSIEQFKTNKKQLEAKELDDLPDEKIKNIYKAVAIELDQRNAREKLMNGIYLGE